jgi:hypothetical protein
MEKKIRALGLCSGGLDSQLAVCVLKEQGIEVEIIVFDSPFYNPDPAIAAAEQLGVRLHVIDFTKEITGLVNDPPHGFGSCMNPCIDCHALMFRRAGEMMLEQGFDFIFTGEVLNQRPMSQNRRSLGIVAEDSDFGDLVLRPLSAQLLDPTKPEREGWVEREKLLALSGRGRKPQFALAEKYGIKEYPSPAGGCRLTEPQFSERLADLKKHEGLDDSRDLKLLRYGRHFRFDSGMKLILGRYAADNVEIESLINGGDFVLTPADLPGPTGILSGGASDNDVKTAASVLVRYLKVSAGSSVAVKIQQGSEERVIEATAMTEEAVNAMLVAKS